MKKIIRKGWVDSVKYNEICGLLPIVSVDVAMFNQEGTKLLLFKRQVPPIVGTWCLPGGGIRLGETPFTTAKREILEETGIEVKSLVETHHVVTYFFGYKQNIAIGLVTKVDDVPIRLDNEHDEYMWTDINNLPSPIHETMKEQISNCITTLRNDNRH